MAARTVEPLTFIPKTQLLAQAYAKAGERDRRGMVAMHAQYVTEFEESNRDPDAQREGLAAGVHRIIDEAVSLLGAHDPAAADRIACRKGCAHCCYIPVDITPDEAKLLHMMAREAGLDLDMPRLRLQALNSRPDAWAKLSAPLRRCVFLGADSACQVYEWRPGACRKYQVLDTADKCDTVRHYGARVLNFVSVPAEIMQSAAVTVFGGGPMAQQLLAAWPKGEP